jgi:GNAT superfamily N-acetyltransferase
LTSLLERIDAYCDAVPRAASRVEELGSLRLFVKEGPGWPYYARPIPGAPSPTAEQIARMRERQRELGVPEALEWIHDVQPRLVGVARSAGMKVREAPLMVLGQGRWRTPDPPDGITVRLLRPGDPALAASGAVQHIGFGHPGTEVGEAGPAERDASAVGRSAIELDFLSERIRNGLTQPAVAEDETGPLSGGSHQMVGDVSAIVGVATLPSARRRGLGALVTARLVQDARERGAELVFIEAETPDVARIYGRLGFERIGTACIAEPA